VPLNAKFFAYILMLLMVPQIVILARYGCRQAIFSPIGCREPKKVENHCSTLNVLQTKDKIVIIHF
jgi:hypothetical protein